MYRRSLQKLTSEIRKETRQTIIPLLRRLEPEYVGDAYAAELEMAIDALRSRFNNIAQLARIISNSFVDRTNNLNKQRFYTAMNNATGIDLQTLIANERLDDILLAKTRENVSLIKTIPEEYFKTLENIVFSGTTQSNSATSMISQITKLGHSTTERARLIARDQTSKLNAALTQQRAENIGSEEYIWRTAGDGDRVRPTHRSKNGKVFRWDSPPKDTGHPGHDIQCRCVAEPIINV